MPPQTLGLWLGVDAVVYGEVTRYEAFYAMLVSAWRVGAEIQMISTHAGETLFVANGSRSAVDLMPAFDPIDVAINGAVNATDRS